MMNSKWLSVFSLLVSLLTLGYVVTQKQQPSPVVTAPEASVPAPAVVSEKPISNLVDLSQRMIEVAEKVKPAVVTVSIEKIYTQRVNPFPFFDSPFDGFFGDFFGAPRERKFKASGLGSGVIVNKDGTILTNNHVVADADTIVVGTLDNRFLKAKVIGRDPKTDIAVIQVEAEGLKPLELGDSDRLRVGEIVLAVGSPMNKGLAHTVTQGIVSAVGRANVGLAEYEDFIQTDAAINPGNSGGALVDLNGKLVGINTAIASQSGGSQGIGFAVPVNMASVVMESLKASGKVTRGWIGVASQDITEELKKALELGTSVGALVSDVSAGGPADQAGLKRGDVVLKFNGDEISNSAQFRNRIATSKPGTSVSLDISRKSQPMKLSLKIGEPNKEKGSEKKIEVWGMSLSDLSEELSQEYRIQRSLKGVVITHIGEQSPMREVGLEEGDLIQAFNQRAVTSVEEFKGLLKSIRVGDLVRIQILRGNAAFLTTFQAPR